MNKLENSESKPIPVAPLEYLRSTLPAIMVEAENWLVWRDTRNEDATERARKIPYYLDGQQRFGELEAGRDTNSLASLDAAYETYQDVGYDGIGFAVTKRDPVAGLDFDHCLTAGRELKSDFSGKEDFNSLVSEGAYIEVSPSGDGLRIFGVTSETVKRSFSESDKETGTAYEGWTNLRYLTVTGNVWDGNEGDPARPVNLDAYFDRMAAENGRQDGQKPPENAEDYDEWVFTPSKERELLSALSAIPNHDYGTWTDIAHQLRTLDDELGGDRGWKIFLEWSKGQGYEFDEKAEIEARRVWGSIDPERVRSHWKGIFRRAYDNGWTKPKKDRPARYENDDYEGADEGGGDDDRRGEGRRRGVDYERIIHASPDFTAEEFAIDGFIPLGISTVAGGWGVGKTSNLFPLILSVPHFANEEWGFWPDERRKVIWVTEDPDQVFNIAKAMVLEGDGGSWDQFHEWVYIYSAKRRNPIDVAYGLRRLADEMTYIDQAGFEVRPVVVVDTSSANFDLQNESDNSEVGRAWAALKEKLSGFPVIVVEHIAKALRRADIRDMTSRGGGAKDADARQTFFMVFDEDSGQRFMAIGKRRFVPDFDEINFGTVEGVVAVETRRGKTRLKRYQYGVPEKSSRQERLRAEEQRRRERIEGDREEAWQAAREAVLQEVRRLTEEGQLPSATDLRKAMSIDTNLKPEVLSSLEDDGSLVLRPIKKTDIGQSGPGRPSPLYFLPETDIEAFLEAYREQAGQVD